MAGHGVVGRAVEIGELTSALAAGFCVLVSGSAGVGKSTVVDAALADRRVLLGCGLATMAWRPWLALSRAFQAMPPGGPVHDVVDWAAAIVGDDVLVLDDAQFADASTIAAVARLASRVAVVVIVRTGEPASESTLATLLRVDGVVHIPLGPLPGDDAIELCERRGVSPATARQIVAFTGGHPLWSLMSVNGDASTSVTYSVAARLGRLDLGGRTVLASLGLLGRPAHAELLGAGVEAAVRAGLARRQGDLVEAAHPIVATIAAARLHPHDRAELHLALGQRLADPGEAARHLFAGHDRTAAAEAARSAATAAHGAVERAAHLELVAACTGAATDALVAARACLAAGDGAGVERWSMAAITDASVGAAAWALRAVAARQRGDVRAARQFVEAGLSWQPTGADLRRLQIESHLVASPPPTVEESAALVASCAAHAEEPAARLAATAASVAAGRGTWLAEAHDALGAARRCGDGPTELEIRWVLVAGTARTGRLRVAAAHAMEAGETARHMGADHWAARFDAEAQWLRAIDGSPPVGAEVAALCAETGAVDGIVAAARLWTGVAVLGALRCSWGAAQRAIDDGDTRGPKLIADAVALAESSGLRALDGRLAATSKQVGVTWRRRGGESAHGLTSREAEVMRLVGEGLSTRMAARRLGISATTVDTHIRSAVLKLGAPNRRAAASRLGRQEDR